MPPTSCIYFYTKYSISGGSAGFHYQGDLRVLEGLRLNLRAAAVGNFWLTRLPLSPPPSPLSVTIHTMLSFNTVYFITSVIRYISVLCNYWCDHPSSNRPPIYDFPFNRDVCHYILVPKDLEKGKSTYTWCTLVSCFFCEIPKWGLGRLQL